MVCCRGRGHSLLFSGAKHQDGPRSGDNTCSPIKVFQISLLGGSFVLTAIFACEPPNTRWQNADADGKVRAFFAPTGSGNMLHQIASGSQRQRGFCTVTDSMWVVEVAQLRLCSCEKVAVENRLLEMTAM